MRGRKGLLLFDGQPVLLPRYLRYGGITDNRIQTNYPLRPHARAVSGAACL